MTPGVFEDTILWQLAKEVVPPSGSEVSNAQVTGLLAIIRASGSHAALRLMTQRQREKARRDGDRGEDQAAFFERLYKALQTVEKHAGEFGRDSLSDHATKAELRDAKDEWSARFSLTLMTHVAAEHRWRAKGREK